MTQPYGYAWNAAIVCGDCVRERLITALTDSNPFMTTEAPTLSTEELSERYARYVLDHEGPIGDLDTAVFPQPSWDGETLSDSCDSCHQKIEDTL